jgi:hypothetical protein
MNPVKPIKARNASLANMRPIARCSSLFMADPEVSPGTLLASHLGARS